MQPSENVETETISCKNKENDYFARREDSNKIQLQNKSMIINSFLNMIKNIYVSDFN